MGDPVLDEIRRARTPIREDVLRRWARYAQDVLQPQLDRLAEFDQVAREYDQAAQRGRTRRGRTQPEVSA